MSEYDPIVLIQEFEAIGMKAKHICGLLGISETSMSRARTGAALLPGQDMLNMRNLLAECKELARRSPLQISWSDLRAVRRQLDALRNELKTPPTIEQSDWDLVTAVSGGIDPVTIAKNLDIPVPELSARLAAASERLGAVANFIGRANRGQQELREQQKADRELRLKSF